MSTGPYAKLPNTFVTEDEFVAEVPWDYRRSVLVIRRQLKGGTFVRFRTWNLHQTKDVWYPTKRGFVIPIDDAEPLADALRAAANGETVAKPEWLVDYEREEEERLKHVKS